MKKRAHSADKPYVKARLYFCLILCSVSLIGEAAPTGYIIQISRKLKMSSTDVSPNKDFYVDLGEKQGIKLGDTFSVYRDMAVMNEVIGDASNLIRVPIGEVTIFLVGEHTSIGRLTATVPPQNLPVMAQPFVRVGDSVQLKTSLPFEPKAP